MKTSQDFLVAGFGIVTSAGTALPLILVNNWLEISFHSLTLWFVIPVGAIISGFAAASGFWLGSHLFNHRPTSILLINMASIAVGTFFLIHYLQYWSHTVDGKPLPDLIAFSDYLSIVFSHTSIQFRIKGARVGEAFELGSVGYAYAAIQLVGFCLGGIAVYLHLKSQPYCDECGKYLAKKGLQTRYGNKPDSFSDSTQAVLDMLTQARFQEALVAHASTLSSDAKDANLSSRIEVRWCKKCNKHWLKFSVTKLVGNEWRDIDELGCEAFTASPIEIKPKHDNAASGASGALT